MEAKTVMKRSQFCENTKPPQYLMYSPMVDVKQKSRRREQQSNLKLNCCLHQDLTLYMVAVTWWAIPSQAYSSPATLWSRCASFSGLHCMAGHSRHGSRERRLAPLAPSLVASLVVPESQRIRLTAHTEYVEFRGKLWFANFTKRYDANDNIAC